MEAVLLDLLGRTNNVAITGVVASVAAAHPAKAGEAGYALAHMRHFLERTLIVNSGKFQLARLGAFGLPAISAEKEFTTRNGMNLHASSTGVATSNTSPRSFKRWTRVPRSCPGH